MTWLLHKTKYGQETHLKLRRYVVQALYDMTSHKLQQKLFYLFCTPEGILFDM